MELRRPKAVLFDMGGVLAESAERYDEEGFSKSFPEGIPEPERLDWFMAMSQDCLRRYLALKPPRPPFDTAPVIVEWLERHGMSTDEETVERWRRLLAQWEVRPLYPHTRGALEELHAMGLRLGVVSNVMSRGDHHRELFREGGILRLFDVIVYSSEFGTTKPDPSIFRHALERMGVEPGDAWYVGDKPQRDICGAHAAGMTAVLVDSEHGGRVSDAPENVPDLRIRDISELPGVVEALKDKDHH